MDESSIKQLIQQEIANYQTTFASISVTPHIHNGSDSPQIRSSNLIPYDFIDSLQTSSGNLLPGYEGQIYYNPNTGDQYIYLGGKWNVISLKASGLQAYLNANQSVPDNTLTTIIFDSVLYDPADQYDSLTGIFSTYGFYLIHARATFDASTFAGNPIELSIWNENLNIPLATSYTIDSGDTITAQVSYMANMSVPISVKIKQTSGVAKDLLSGLENTSLYIKDFSNVT